MSGVHSESAKTVKSTGLTRISVMNSETDNVT